LKALAKSVHCAIVELVKVTYCQVLQAGVPLKHAPKRVDHCNVNKVEGDIEKLESSVRDSKPCKDRVKARTTDKIPGQVQLLDHALFVK
jgi:hypothetical protein